MQYGIRALTKFVVAAGLVGAMGHAQAQAQYGSLKPSWYLVPQISGFEPDNDYGVKHTGIGGGLLLGAPVSDDFDLQLVGEYARISKRGDKLQQALLGGEVLYLFSRGEIQPFISFGLGAERDQRTLAVSPTTQTSSTSPYVSVGLGARWMLTNSIGLQADYRRVEGFLRKSSSWGFKQSGNNYVNLGLVLAFGGEPQRPPAPKLAAVPAPVTPPAPPVVVAPPKVVAPPPPVVAPPPPPAPPVQAPAQRMTLDANKLFALNSARFIPPPPVDLDNYAAAMIANPDVKRVSITGHTDQLGSAAFNNRLSQQRADAIKAYLVSKGVAASRIDARGMGSTKLVTVCNEKSRAAMITCGAPNRRVEVEQISVIKR